MDKKVSENLQKVRIILKVAKGQLKQAKGMLKVAEQQLKTTIKQCFGGIGESNVFIWGNLNKVKYIEKYKSYKNQRSSHPSPK